ncbi:oligosaccharide flippase family protein [Algirhabdus cladophorae]|uniref:oligosaccharide flippase family protein n=1 Tax=Algirhabdus cladophorae TaxID=3377108 RepID=UPI003B845845
MTVITRIKSLFDGDGLRARALRGSVLTFVGFGSGQFLRLLSNLVLTRLLFPEAFGLMAIIQTVLLGLQMISDTGLNTAIVQSKNGEKRVFLDTAWTVQIVRAILLWLLIIAVAGPVAHFYAQPQLAQLLPVAGLTIFILGFQSTNFATANRKLVLGRLTALELISQAIGIFTMVALAWWTGSIWALVIGTVIGTAARVVMTYTMLPGEWNKLAWDSTCFKELFDFGKYIFIGSLAGFVVNNADRAVLGKYVPIAELGIYNIGFFLAAIPLLLNRQFGSKILLPIYSNTPPAESAQNRKKLRLARLLLTSTMLGMGFVLALLGTTLIDLLYEPVYALSGPILVLLSLANMPLMIIYPYGVMLLGMGNSRSFTVQQLCQAGVYLALLILAVQAFGIIGVMIAQVVSVLCVYPLLAWFAHRYRGWDPLLDAGLFAVALAISVIVLWLNDQAIAEILRGIVD